jgi:2-C-methyl-D-erythritol 4-phosphate cytidylyltransferase
LILAAAGAGARLDAGKPKALVELCGRPLMLWSLEAFSSLPFERRIVTAPAARLQEFRRVLDGQAEVLEGGKTRSGSVRRAFESLRAHPDDLVCIHDAARPLVSADEASRVLGEAERVGAAIAATPVVDTLKQARGDRVQSTLERTGLYAAGTPQAFRAAALEKAFRSGVEATDEAALCEAAGVAVAIVSISRLGFKITTREDLEMAEAILTLRRSSAPPGRAGQ